MKNIVIKSSPGEPFYPLINFNAQTGICELSGESYMEDTFKFYSPLLEWLNDYVSEIKKPITFNFKLTYFNTNSSRAMLDIMDILLKYENAGGEITVNWYVDEKDPDMKDEVEDFIIESGLKINLIEF